MQTIKRKVRRQSARATQVTVQPTSVEEVVSILKDRKSFPSPVRPIGSNSGTTRGSHARNGTIVDMTAMNKFMSMTEDTVTVGAGMPLKSLANRLAEHDMELAASYEYPERTVGGVISSGSLSAATPSDLGHLATSVTRMTLVTPQGRRIDIDTDMPDLMRMVRQSYGLLGIICSATLRIRPIRHYTIRNREFSFEELGNFIPEISTVKAGVKLYLLPFRDRAFVELRFEGNAEQPVRKLPWKIRDWACNSALPDFVHSVGRVVPIGRLRDPLIDGFSEAAQRLVSKRLAVVGSNAMEQTGQFQKIRASRSVAYCSWLFSAEQFAEVLEQYRSFSQQHYAEYDFRCDLPAIAYRIDQDRASILSPSHDRTMFALTLRSTITDGWDDFLLDFADLASRFSGVPIFNQTGGMVPGTAAVAYGSRIGQFRDLRRQLDPQNRCLNQFFAEHVG